MTNTDEGIGLKTADYVVFGALLCVSAVVGFFFAYKDRKINESGNYLLGNRNISLWASGFSSSLSFVSGATVIGTPAEIVYFGAAYTWFLLGLLMATIVCCEVFFPIYYKCEMSSANEYYGARFGKYARYVATAIFLLQTLSYTGVMIYAPTVALTAVSGFSLWGGVLSVGIVCTLYTTLGGLKAVIWTDVLQGLCLMVVLFVVLFKSANDVGGLGRCLEIASQGGRLDFFHFEFDPRYRMTFWGAIFGIGFMWLSLGATNQSIVQRFLCCRSVSDGKKAMYFSTFCGFVQVGFLLYFIGFVTYAYFSDCDPLLSGEISSADQAVPYMVLLVFAELPGFSGFFIAGVFAAALSTVSSAINGMSSVTVGDLIRPNVNWSESTFLWVSRGLTLLYGGICIGFAYVSSVVGGLVQAALSLLGVCAGPLLGPMIMGVLCPIANESGAISGMITALAFNIWLFTGAWVYPPPVEFLGLKTNSIEGCVNATSNASTPETTSHLTPLAGTTSGLVGQDRPPIANFYAISFTYYSPIGMMICLIVGLVVSYATGGLQSRYDVDPRLIYLPFEHKLLRWLPQKFRDFMKPEMGIFKDPDFEFEEEKKGSEFEWRQKRKEEELGETNDAYYNDEMTTYL